MALSRCVSVSYNTDSSGHRTPERITYSFEFVDDFDVPYSTIKGFLEHIGILQYTPNMFLSDQSSDTNTFMLRSTGKSTNRIESDTVTRLLQQDDNNEKWMQSDYDAENHVLRLMVSIYTKQETRAMGYRYYNFSYSLHTNGLSGYDSMATCKL